jgi:class 3 adenylate cyclase/tetratricopeptide (TPR) repeat protein
VTCPVCGTVAVPGARFCHNCGVALPPAATLPAAERRIVTVLFGDLSDFTAWAEDVDPERVGAVTDRVLAALAGSVKTFGGHVDKLTGDGIMAVFGAPVAHEDDAERAIRAALSMQRAVRRVLDDERGGGAPLGLRVGLNTGTVMAGVQAAIEYTVIGDTVNTAARLADAAAIGAVYAGARTSSATRHVASWRVLRPLRLKGKREPVEAYELLGLLDAAGTRTGLGDEAPFLGRETEVGRLAGRLAEVVDAEQPRIVVMTGEAGLGKTRFAAEFGRFASGYPVGGFAPTTGARVLSVHCAAFGERRRLAPLADLVRAAIGLPADAVASREQVEERLRRLGQRLARHARHTAPTGSLATAPTGAAPVASPTGARHAPAGTELPRLAIDLLLAVVGYGEAGSGGTVPASAGGARGGWGASAGPVDGPELEAIPAAVADLLSALAAEESLLIVVDDLHDATPDTVDALGATLSRLSGPVLVLLLGRPELVRTAGILNRLADAEVTALPPLRGVDSARLLTSYLGGGRLPQPDTDRLLATAQGNPFYLAELVALLQERGLLTSQGDSWHLATGSLGGRLLSRDLAAVLASRIDALPPGARAVLRDASVVGDTVPAGALEALRAGRPDATPAAVAGVELERAVDELLQRRMLRKTRGGYALATPLLREAAYAGLGKADLAERHALLARWSAEPREYAGPAEPREYAGSTLPPEHPGAAASVPDVGGRSRPGRAGMTAEVADAFVAEHAERAGTLADAVGLRADAPARSVAPLGVAALGRLARQALAAGEPARAAEHTARAAALAGGVLGPADRLIQARALLQTGRVAEALGYAEKIAAGEDVAVRSGALLLAGRAYRMTGDPQRAYRTWKEALAAATAGDLPGERAEALRRLGMADYLSGRLLEAGNRFVLANQIAVGTGDRRSQAWSLQNLAWVTTTRGDFTGADAALHRSARRFAELGDPVGRAWLRGTTAFVRMLAGRLAEARRLARVFLPFGERVGDGWAVGTLRSVEAFAAAELGELTEADRGARRAYRDFAAADDDWGRGLALVVRGVIARGLDEPVHATDLLTDALEYGEKTGHPLLIGMARTTRGFVALDRGEVAAAAADARAVLDVVEPHDVEESAHVGPRALLAMTLLASGDATGACGLLADAAARVDEPSLLFPRRQAVAGYAEALLAAGRLDEALDWARRAFAAPGEDVRSRVRAGRVYARALAAVGHRPEALAAATAAVRVAYATQQVGERAAADAVLASLSLDQNAA